MLMLYILLRGRSNHLRLPDLPSDACQIQHDENEYLQECGLNERQRLSM